MLGLISGMIAYIFFPKGEKNVTFAEVIHIIESFYWLAFMGHTHRDVLAKERAGVAFILMNNITNTMFEM